MSLKKYMYFDEEIQLIFIMKNHAKTEFLVKNTHDTQCTHRKARQGREIILIERGERHALITHARYARDGVQ